MVLTPFNQQATDDPKAREEQVLRVPWKRAAEPEEVGRLAVWLGSEETDYVTGQTSTIDGELMMNVGQGA
jgi:glucose 1-dehydrogenase